MTASDEKCGRELSFGAAAANVGVVPMRPERQRPRWLVLSALMCVLLVLPACARPLATVTIRNEGSQPVLWVPTGADLLEKTLASRQDWQQIRPGGEQARQQLGTPNDWCDPDTFMHFILVPRGDLDLDGSNSAPLSIEDFDIVDTVGPGHCWGVREAELVTGRQA